MLAACSTITEQHHCVKLWNEEERAREQKERDQIKEQSDQYMKYNRELSGCTTEREKQNLVDKWKHEHQTELAKRDQEEEDAKEEREREKSKD